MTRSFELICQQSEFGAILGCFLHGGLRLLGSGPQDSPEPTFYDADDASILTQDTIFVLMNEWIVAQPVFNLSSKGSRAGKYSIQPRVNFAGIEVYLKKEIRENSTPRAATISFTSRERPIDGDSYEELDPIPGCIELFSDVRQVLTCDRSILKLGKSRYWVAPILRERLQNGDILPPFAHQDGQIVI